jgi:hypothetical protein
MKNVVMLLVAMLMLAVVGCQGEEYTTMPLGNVPVDVAFKEGKSVMQQYYSLESSDPATGEIVARPKNVEGSPDRLLGKSGARQKAKMWIIRNGAETLAQVSVLVQRQDVGGFAMMQTPTVNNDAPNRSPAEESAALTPEQNTAWEDTTRDTRTERIILMDLLNRVHPETAKPADGGGESPPAPPTTTQP